MTASRSWSGTSEHAWLESASGSIGSTRPGTYTEVARLNASRSTFEPGRTCAATSAMCTHTRTAPSSSSSAEIASSKSRALGGSIVNVGSARRSTRGTSATREAASRASRSASGSKRRRRPRSSISASSTSRATSGRPIRRSTFPWPAPRPVGATSTSSPGRAGPRSTFMRGPREKNGVAVRKRPRLSSTATIGPGRPRSSKRPRSSGRSRSPPERARSSGARRRACRCFTRPRARPPAAPRQAASPDRPRRARRA